ncbi:MAG: S41 family peptidase [Candidatus Omnitrophota bacterium]
MFKRKYFTLIIILGVIGSIFLQGCSNFFAVKETTPNVNSFLTSRYPALPPPPREGPEQRIPLIDGYDEQTYELSYSQKDFYRLRDWKWSPAENLKIELDEGYLLIGHTPCGATAAVILPKGKLLFFEKKFIGWRRISVVNLYMRFPPDTLGNIFSGASIESSEDSEQFSQAVKVVQHKIWNWCCSWTITDKFWKVIIPEPEIYVIDIDTLRGERFGYIVKNNKGKVSPLHIQPLSSPPPLDIKIKSSQAEKNFNLIWSRFDSTYPSFVRKGIDWTAIKKQYELRASQAKTVEEFLDVIQEMLSQLKDAHIWIDTPKGRRYTYDTYNPEVNYSNYNFKSLRKYMKSIKQVGNTILIGKTEDNLAYVAFANWNTNTENDVGKFKKLFPDIMNSRGMIVDVRANYGGSEPLSRKVAELFTDKPVVYARSQFRNGPLHTDLTEPVDRILEPNKERIYYSKPVILLIGQECASSNESFISAMNQLSQVTLVGDRTAGSSGNPTFIELNLPVKISVGIPQWIDLLPDGTPLEEKGIQPDIFIVAPKEDFSGDNDPVLKKGLELLRNNNDF